MKLQNVVLNGYEIESLLINLVLRGLDGCQSVGLLYMGEYSHKDTLSIYNIAMCVFRKRTGWIEFITGHKASVVNGEGCKNVQTCMFHHQGTDETPSDKQTQSN